MKGAHFFLEENPDETAVIVKQFLSAWPKAINSLQEKIHG
jgi:hypothetical protein